MRVFIYDLDREDEASVCQQFTRSFPEVGEVDIGKLDSIRFQYDSLRHQVKLFS